MSRFPEILLPVTLIATLAAAVAVPAAAQTAASGQPADAVAAPAAPAAADAQPAQAAAPGASSGSDSAAQAEAAGTAPEAGAATGAEAAAAAAAASAEAPADTATAGTASPWPGAGARIRLGREALPEEIAAWDIDVRPDGQGLPDGEGDVATGEELFSEHCASCHGEFAEGVDNWPKLAGGKGTLAHEDPLKTVGSFWPHLSTSWDYIHRSMPFGAAQTLDADQTYAVVAYILYSNDLVEDDFVLNKETFATVKLPNAEGFVPDDRDKVELPAFSKEPCMTGCKEKVEVTRRAAILDVTPGGVEDGASADDPAAPKMD